MSCWRCAVRTRLRVWLGSWLVGRGELYLEGMWLYIKLIVTGGYVRNEIEVDLPKQVVGGD